jgi:purine-nucleoside phosphorylase
MSLDPGDGLAERAAEAVRGLGGPRPDVAIILGSGLGASVDGMRIEAECSYEDIPGFPQASVPGHTGRLVLGRLADVPVATFMGRIHYYEGHPMNVVTLPARVAAALGARVVIATAAVGGLDGALGEGTLVVGEDHISFLGENPLRGWRDEDGRAAFVDLSGAYDRELAELAMACAAEVGVPAARGVYAAMPGPTYETPAETELIRRAGATVVGMSIVPEALASAALGLRFAGLFCVTNVVGAEPVDHHHVTEAGNRFARPLGDLLSAMLPKI